MVREERIGDCRKLTDRQVAAIRAWWREGRSSGSIVREIGSTRMNTVNAIRGRTYADVPGAVTDAEWEKRHARGYRNV